MMQAGYRKLYGGRDLTCTIPLHGASVSTRRYAQGVERYLTDRASPRVNNLATPVNPGEGLCPPTYEILEE